MKTVQNPTSFFFQQSENPTSQYKDEIEKFVKQLINLDQCVLCKENYNFQDKLPRILIHCGHTFCHSCLSNFFKNMRIRCPLCLKLIKNIESIERLPINHTIFTKIAKQINSQNIDNGQQPIDYRAALYQQFEAQSAPNQDPIYTNNQHQKNPQQPNIDPETGLEFCQNHQDRIKHFFCMAHKETCCRVCTEIVHNQKECMIADLYQIEDIPGFLSEFAEDDKNDKKDQNFNINQDQELQEQEQLINMGIYSPENDIRIQQDPKFSGMQFEQDDAVQFDDEEESDDQEQTSFQSV